MRRVPCCRGAGRPWSRTIPHDHGVMTLLGDEGIRAAARALAIVNGTQRGGGFTQDILESAVRKVDESSQLSGYFNRVLTIALRSHWGRGNDDMTVEARAKAAETLTIGTSDIERLAFRLTGRTFWGHGGIGSEPSTALLDVPLVDRLAPTRKPNAGRSKGSLPSWPRPGARPTRSHRLPMRFSIAEEFQRRIRTRRPVVSLRGPLEKRCPGKIRLIKRIRDN